MYLKFTTDLGSTVGQGDWETSCVCEQERWKNLRFPYAIAYATGTAALEEGEFEQLGREIPSGTCIKNSLEDDHNEAKSN